MTSSATYGSGSIVTPEAVVLDFEIAGVGSRSLAICIDLAIQLACMMAFVMAAGLLAGGSELAGFVVMLVGLIAVLLGYPVFFEALRDGRTPGRRVVGTRVVTVEGAPIRFRQALVRSLLGIVDLYLLAGGVAIVTALLTTRGQRLGDLVAGTMVIRDRDQPGSAGGVGFWPPDYLARWSQTVDTGQLGNDGYQLVRDLLSREGLSDQARRELELEASAMVSRRLPHAARPDTVPPRDYLLAIASASQYGSHRGAAPPPPTGLASRRVPAPPGVDAAHPAAVSPVPPPPVPPPPVRPPSVRPPSVRPPSVRPPSVRPPSVPPPDAPAAPADPAAPLPSFAHRDEGSDNTSENEGGFAPPG